MAIINVIDKICSSTERSVTINGTLLDDDSQPLLNQQLVIAGLDSVIVTSGQDGFFSGSVLAVVDNIDYSIKPISVLYKPDAGNFVKVTIQPIVIRPTIDTLDEPIWVESNTTVKVHGHIVSGTGETINIYVKNNLTGSIDIVSINLDGTFDYYSPIFYKTDLSLMPYDLWGFDKNNVKSIIPDFATWSFSQLFPQNY